MKVRRLRPTFLLQITVLVTCVAIFAAAFFLFESTGLRIGVLLALLFVWVIGMELELLPMVLEEVALVIAGGSAREPSRIWFVDLDEEEKRDRARLNEELRDNPTLK